MEAGKLDKRKKSIIGIIAVIAAVGIVGICIKKLERDGIIRESTDFCD